MEMEVPIGNPFWSLA